jgi:hypothetical protein
MHAAAAIIVPSAGVPIDDSGVLLDLGQAPVRRSLRCTAPRSEGVVMARSVFPLPMLVCYGARRRTLEPLRERRRGTTEPTNADVADTVHARCREVGDSYQGDEWGGCSTGIRHGWWSVTELMPASLGVLWEH